MVKILLINYDDFSEHLVSVMPEAMKDISIIPCKIIENTKESEEQWDAIDYSCQIAIINCGKPYHKTLKALTQTEKARMIVVATTPKYTALQMRTLMLEGFDDVIPYKFTFKHLESIVDNYYQNKYNKYFPAPVQISEVDYEKNVNHELISHLIRPNPCHKRTSLQCVNSFTLNENRVFWFARAQFIPDIFYLMQGNIHFIFENLLNTFVFYFEDLYLQNNYRFKYASTQINQQVVFLFSALIQENMQSVYLETSLLLQETIRMFRTQSNYHLVIGISEITENIFDSHILYEEAGIAMDSTFYNNKPQTAIIPFDQQQIYSGIPSGSLQEKINKITTEQNDIKNFRDIFNQLWNIFASNKLDVNYVRKFITTLFNKITFESVSIPYQHKLTIYNNHNIEENIKLICSYAVIGEYLQSIIDDIINLTNSRESKTDLLIASVKLYISKHYSEPIKLQDIADYVHVNPHYLCELFKKHTEIGLFDYILKVRLLNAEALLANTDQKIYTIGQEVGYPEAVSFNRMFKRETGMTPKQYRDALIKNKI